MGEREARERERQRQSNFFKQKQIKKTKQENASVNMHLKNQKVPSQELVQLKDKLRW